MNENPEGAPSSLTPAPDAVASTPTSEEPTSAKPDSATKSVTQIKPKKGKLGLVLGLTAGFLALAGVTVALLFVFVFNKGGDPMTNAISKLLNGENRNIAVAGDFNYDLMGISLNVGFDAQFDSTAKVGVATADLTGDFGGMSINANVEARMTGDDNAYLKISGLRDTFSNIISQSGIECSGDECDQYLDSIVSGISSSDPTGGMLGALLELDGEWVKLDNVNLTSNITLPAGLSFDSINGHKSEIVEAYKKNPFIKTSTEDLKITKKANTLYKISFDYEKMANFSNEVAKILGSNSTSVTAAQLESTYKDAGTAYVEIDGNNNITRLYFEASGMAAQDFTLSYPANVNVAVPESYTTSDIINSIFNNAGGSSYIINGGGDIEDCDSETDDCTDDTDTFDIDLDDLEDFQWIWDDDED